MPLTEARAFAESVAGSLERCGAAPASPWAPGDTSEPPSPELFSALDDLGWRALAEDPSLTDCAGLAAIELGRRLAPVVHIDRLLGGGPVVGELVRSLGSESIAVLDGRLVSVRRSEPVASAEGIDVRRVLELGDAAGVLSPAALSAWTAASVGYLAGLGQGALDLTVEYVGQRRAFGSTLAALGPVQQLLAGAATAVRGASLLAAESANRDALAHAGHAAVTACAACHQVTGAIGFTLEYALHRYMQRARAIAVWNEALFA